MAMNQIQRMQWGAPGDEAGDREKREDNLEHEAEIPPGEAGLGTGRSALAGTGGLSQQKQSSWIHGHEVQVRSQKEGCGLLVHSGLWQQLSINCGLYVMMVIEIVFPFPTLFPIFIPLEVQKQWSGAPLGWHPDLWKGSCRLQEGTLPLLARLLFSVYFHWSSCEENQFGSDGKVAFRYLGAGKLLSCKWSGQ